MKNKSFHINFGSISDLADEARAAMKSGKGSKEPSAMFSDLDDFMTFMFPSKFMLLMMIKAKQPSSMYELAQMVKRSQSGVLRDCKELEVMGFITLTQEGPRNSMRPTLSFDHDSLTVHTDAGECLHVLPSAA